MANKNRNWKKKKRMSMQLVVNDVLLNFDTIAQLHNHQTLQVVGTRVYIDTRMFQFARRTWSGDNRQVVIQAIEKTLATSSDILKSYSQNQHLYHYIHQTSEHQSSELAELMLENMKKILDRVEPAIRGLETWKTYQRYIHDYDFQHKVNDCMEQLKSMAKKYQPLIDHSTTNTSQWGLLWPCSCSSKQQVDENGINL